MKARLHTNSKSFFKMLKYNILLNKGMVIFFSVFLLIIFLSMVLVYFLIAKGTGKIGLPTLDSYSFAYVTIKHGSGSQNVWSFGSLVYYFYAFCGFLVLSASSIYFSNKIFMSEIKGKMINWLFTGNSKINVFLSKFISLQIIHFLIYIPVVFVVFALSFIGSHSSGEINNLFLMTFSFILFVFCFTSIYFTISMIFFRLKVLFFTISILFLLLTLGFSTAYIVSDTLIKGALHPENYNNTIYSKMKNLKFTSLLYFFNNLFIYKELSPDIQKQLINFQNEFIGKKDAVLYFKREILKINKVSIFIRDLILFLFVLLPLTFIYLITEKRDYNL